MLKYNTHIKIKLLPILFFSVIFILFFILDVLSNFQIFIIKKIVTENTRMRTIGDVFGYIAFFTLFLTMITRIGIYRFKKYLNPKKLIKYHNIFGIITIFFGIIHVIALSLSEGAWSSIFKFYEIFPWDNIYSNRFLGLLFGRITLLIIFAIVVTGTFVSTLRRRKTRKRFVIIHKLAYLTMFFVIFHFIFIVKINHAHLIALLIMILTLVFTIILTVDLKHRLFQKRKNCTIKENLKTFSTT